MHCNLNIVLLCSALSAAAVNASTWTEPEPVPTAWHAPRPESGGSEQIRLLVRHLDVPDDAALTDERLQAACDTMDTLCTLAAESGGLELLLDEFSRAHAAAGEEFKFYMISTLGHVDCGAAQTLLLDWLRMEPSSRIKSAILRALKCPRFPGAGVAVETMLFDPDGAVKKEAALVLGRMQYLPAIPGLAGLCDSEQPGVRETAVWALENMTGERFVNAARAKTRLAERKKEDEERYAALMRQLRDGDQELAPLVLEELSTLVFPREKIIPVAMSYIVHPDFRVRAAACQVLGAAGHLPPLIDKLDDCPEVSFAAWRALRKATNMNLPREYPVWLAWVRKQGL